LHRKVLARILDEKEPILGEGSIRHNSFWWVHEKDIVLGGVILTFLAANSFDFAIVHGASTRSLLTVLSELLSA
jgi:hypothetical protein